MIRDTTLKIKSRDWYFFLQANYKLSTSQEAKSRKLQLDTIINYWSEVEKLINISPSGYDAKMKKIKSKTENDLKAFPIALIKEPYDDGKYKLAIVRAQKELEKITKKDEEEIVYLLIASAFKYAKKGKRFERYERFVHTNKLLKLYSFKLKNESLKEKLSNLEGKIKKGLTKYQINAE